MRTKALILIIILLLIAGALLFYLSQKYNWFKKSIIIEPMAEQESLGNKLYRAAKGPAAFVPETNPFKARTNPFEIKLNPFR